MVVRLAISLLGLDYTTNMIKKEEKYGKTKMASQIMRGNAQRPHTSIIVILFMKMLTFKAPED